MNVKTLNTKELKGTLLVITLLHFLNLHLYNDLKNTGSIAKDM